MAPKDSLERYIEQTFGVETEGPLVDLATQVAERLQEGHEHQLRVVVPLLDEHVAWTSPGNVVYVSRQLLARCTSAGAVAFVIAHELAHQELGHVPSHRESSPQSALNQFMRYVYAPELERAADQRAVELCLSAGYEADRCVDAVKLLASLAVDVQRPGDDAPTAWHQRRGYQSTERETEVLAHIRRLTREGEQVVTRCRYCRNEGAIVCPRCKHGYCVRHRPRRTVHCASCRVDELTLRDKLKAYGWSFEFDVSWWAVGLTVLALVVFVLLLTMGGTVDSETVTQPVQHPPTYPALPLGF